MSSSLPVPSKAALTALRGLVVGTSCTLAIIAEDRRRKINNAVRVIENGERIRSAKGYRPGGAALALAMEEEALWDPGFSLTFHQQHANTASALSFTRDPKNEGGILGRQVGVENVAEAPLLESTKDEETVVFEQPDVTNTKNPKSSTQPAQASQHPRSAKPLKLQPIRQPPKLATARKRTGPSWLWTNGEVIKSYAFPSGSEIADKVHKVCETKDPRQVTVALRTVLEAIDRKFAPDNQNQTWIEATALLCRTCQELGLVDDAAKLLYRVINSGEIEETAYLNHRPFALIESLLARTELNEQSQDAYTANVDTAINLFVPNFTVRPTAVDAEVCRLGRKVLEACFEANRLRRIFGVYRRCNLVAGKNSKASVHAIGDMVVDSVELAHNHRPEDVLKTLHSVCSNLGDTKLNPKWVIKLFVSHWKKHGNFGEIEAMFEQLQTPRLRDAVFRSDNIYRIMIELALEAGEEAKADSYFLAAIAQNPALASDARLLGVIARFHAADGDWEAVRADFEAMNQRGRPSDKAYGQVFVPVLKAYAETHTVRETEAFLKSYRDELKVPLCSYMVTLMAKQYAAIRDVGSLIDWLDYCRRANFPVDAAFTNSILVRCRRQWKFPFRELRTLFRKLQALNPAFVDKHTEQVMADAALSDSKHGGKAAKGRLLSLRVDINKAPYQGKLAQVDDVILAMKEALACKCPRRALWIYKRALHLNMPYSQQTLRLAVQAQLTADPRGYDAAYELLRSAESKGADINHATNYLLAKQLDTITSSPRNPADTTDTIEATLAQYHKAGVRLTETALNRAALTCLGAGHFRGAVAYALQAANARGPSSSSSSSLQKSGPCFNLHNFRILLAAYAELVDVDGLRDTISRALASYYREDGACRTALRYARARVMHSRARPVSPEERTRARAVVDEGWRRSSRRGGS
ncbi:hypothetical protein NEMBOFW57_007476 [Staphylotrichum longicolle]|uniref:Uncharacterized protein n=1 Tax=Staphylotrichum longicolle TaxID=669026 RepID=A0AAD4HXG5_9PEZI|nr:hypothetical protein NEMBOFW57_007476 [Staphylotrichum longicolle]